MTVLLPSLPLLLAFLGASLVTLVIPGPSVAYVVARSVEQGRRGGLYSVLGLETGAAVHVLAAAVGLSALLASSEIAFTVTKYAGIGYLVWLAVREFRRTTSGAPSLGPATGRTGAFRLYVDGLLIDLLNPKTALFFLAFLPQFVDPAKSMAPQFTTLGLLFIGLAALVGGTYAVLAGRFSRRLRASRNGHHHLRRATGGVYLALAGVAVIA